MQKTQREHLLVLHFVLLNLWTNRIFNEIKMDMMKPST